MKSVWIGEWENTNSRPSVYCRARRAFRGGWYEWWEAATHRISLYKDFQVSDCNAQSTWVDQFIFDSILNTVMTVTEFCSICMPDIFAAIMFFAVISLKLMLILIFYWTNWFNFIWITQQIFAFALNTLHHVMCINWRPHRDHRLCDITFTLCIIITA